LAEIKDTCNFQLFRLSRVGPREVGYIWPLCVGQVLPLYDGLRLKTLLPLPVYVSVCACERVYICIHTYVTLSHTHTCTRIHANTCTRTHARTHAYTHTYTCTRIEYAHQQDFAGSSPLLPLRTIKQICICLYLYTHTHRCIYTLTHTYKHTHTHTHTHTIYTYNAISIPTKL